MLRVSDLELANLKKPRPSAASLELRVYMQRTGIRLR